MQLEGRKSHNYVRFYGTQQAGRTIRLDKLALDLERGMAPGTEGSRLVSRRGKVAEGGKRSKWAPLPPPHPSSTRLATFLQIQTRNEPRRPALPGGLYERVTTHWVNR